MQQKKIERVIYFVLAFLVSTLVIQKINHTSLPIPIQIQPPSIQAPISPPRPQPLSLQESQKSIKSENLRKLLYYLASEQFGGRVTGSNGDINAARFIHDYFYKCGLKTNYQTFWTKMGASGNIIANLEGTTKKNEIVVIGAHMDGQFPGVASGTGNFFPSADDNASGTVAVMEIAKAFTKSKVKFPRTISFQCYSGEELGLVGSKHYVNHPLFPIKQHVFMINLDMIGYYKGQNIMYAGATGGASDHMPFYNKGISCVFIHTGMHPYYHTAQDTPDKINYQGMEQVVRAAFALAWTKAQGGTEKIGSWQKVEFKYDHGNPNSPFEFCSQNDIDTRF